VAARGARAAASDTDDWLSQHQVAFGTAWQGANFELIDKTPEIAPGITLIALVSEAPGTKELKELSLAVNTPDKPRACGRLLAPGDRQDRRGGGHQSQNPPDRRRVPPRRRAR
jgi:hypothetical protein